MDKTIINLIKKELFNPTIEMTRQYLEILEVEYEDGLPKIIKIDFDESENTATAYVRVKREAFYLEFIVDTTDEGEVFSVDTCPYVGVAYMAVSKELTLKELLSLTKLNPDSTMLKGKPLSGRVSPAHFNKIEFYTGPEPGSFMTKLNNMLDVLKEDIEGVKALCEKTDSKDLFVTIIWHKGTGAFTDIYLDTQTIDKLSALGLELTFDLYAAGNEFRN